MPIIKIQGCGSSYAMGQKAELNIGTNDFGIEVNRKFYRIEIDRDGGLVFCLINGVDARIVNSGGYPAVKLIHS